MPNYSNLLSGVNMKEITLKDYEQKANAVIELGFNVIEKNLGRIILALIEEIRRLKNQKQSGS